MSGVFPTPPCASLRELALLALPPPLDQGCLLLSTPNNTPITRARPPCRPIGSLRNSTFPWGRGGNWLERLSVKWASRKDAAGVLGTRSPERRRSNLPINKIRTPTPRKQGAGELRLDATLGPTTTKRAECRVGESLPQPPALHCSCKHVSFLVCFPFSLTVAITGCCLPKSHRAPPWPHAPGPVPSCLFSGFPHFLSVGSTQ